MLGLESIRVWRKRWRTVLTIFVVCVGGAVLGLSLVQSKYTSTVQLFVAAQDPAVSGANANQLQGAYQGGLFTQQRVQSYVSLANSDTIVRPIRDELRLDRSTGKLASEISARAPANTVLVEISVTDPSARLAQRVAALAAQNMIRVVDRLERPSAGGVSPVKMSVSIPATRPTSPSSPKVPLIVAVAVLLGLFLGAAVALLRERLDTSVKSADDVSVRTGLSVLATIPQERDLRGGVIDQQSFMRGPRGEALRQLRTNLQFMGLEDPPKTILVTSSIPTEGKSSTSCGLALALAEAGRRVILVDADLRKPSIGRYLDVQTDVGVTNVLLGHASAEDVLQETAADGDLRVVLSGPIPPNPSELLGTSQMAQLLTQLSDMADMVIVDAPPLLPVTDAAILGTLCDGAVMVAGYGYVTHDQMTKSLATLRQVDVRILGIVLNRMPAGEHGYYQNYGYYAPSGGAGVDTQLEPSHIDVKQ